MADPMEAIVREALNASGMAFVEEEDPLAKGLDFHLPFIDVHIEVAQFHSERIGEQISRAPNVITIQGIAAAKLFAQAVIGASRMPSAQERYVVAPPMTDPRFMEKAETTLDLMLCNCEESCGGKAGLRLAAITDIALALQSAYDEGRRDEQLRYPEGGSPILRTPSEQEAVRKAIRERDDG